VILLTSYATHYATSSDKLSLTMPFYVIIWR
jgi:hypothetical protein